MNKLIYNNKESPMKLYKKIILTCLLAAPLVANASDLKIANQTKFNLSFKFNNTCSDAFGVIKSNTIKIISEKDFNNACEDYMRSCFATVYNQANCKGKVVAGIGFNKEYGVSYISGRFKKPINITGNGFNLIFSSPIK